MPVELINLDPALCSGSNAHFPYCVVDYVNHDTSDDLVLSTFLKTLFLHFNYISCESFPFFFFLGSHAVGVLLKGFLLEHFYQCPQQRWWDTDTFLNA